MHYLKLSKGVRFSAAIFIACYLVSATNEPEVRFVDITQAAKIDFRHQASATSNKYLLETMGGGVALLDYDNDGRLDIFFTNGSHLSDPMKDGDKPDKSDPKFWNRLYHQSPDGTFTDVTERAGLTGMPQNRYNMGVAVGDFDNDGFEDIYVTGFDGNTLYRNNGDGTFTDVTKRAGVAASGWSTSAGFFDYDNDGKLDLFVCRYLKWTFQTNRYCGEHRPGYRAYCHPDNFDGATNILYHNNGDGTFTDVSETAGVSNPEGKSLGVAFADYDGDGRTDIFVANDSVRCFLYHNDGKGKFSDVSLASGTAYSEDGKTFAGMGTDFSDFDNDGRPDIVVTDLSNERYMLFHNDGDGTFSDITNSSGLGSATLAHSGWSTHFFDYDNDGWKDLFAVQGHVLDTIELTAPNLKYKEPPLLLRNVSNHFVKALAGPVFTLPWAGRGAAFGDLDNDGDVDIVAGNLNEKPYLLRNEGGNRNHWIGITTVGRRSNRDGIGCRVRVVSKSGLSQYYTVNTAIGYLSASDKRLIVGLGPDATAKLIEIRWPSGVMQRFENVTAGQMLNATEPVR